MLDTNNSITDKFNIPNNGRTIDLSFDLLLRLFNKRTHSNRLAWYLAVITKLLTRYQSDSEEAGYSLKQGKNFMTILAHPFLVSNTPWCEHLSVYYPRLCILIDRLLEMPADIIASIINNLSADKKHLKRVLSIIWSTRRDKCKDFVHHLREIDANILTCCCV